jgi:hypothetical protein
MQAKTIRTVCFWMAFLAMAGLISSLFGLPGFPDKERMRPALAETGDGNDAEIQWFRDQLGIADQYRQDHEVIWGISWAHFFTMVLLLVFSLAVFLVFVQRQKRTRELLEMIQKEMNNGNKG